VRSSEKASERFRAGFLTSRSHDHGCPCPKRLPANPRRLLRRCQHKAPIRCVAERYTSGDVAVFSRTVLPSIAAALHMHDAAQYAPIIIALKPRLSCPSSSPTARPARSRQRHRSSSDLPEQLWSKDQAASRLNHRCSDARLRLKPLSDRNRFRGVVTEDRMSNDAAGGSLRN
jgi:hypothetical protein